MVLGQAIDCYFEKKRLELSELEFLHLHKTGKLIASSLKMGAIICNLDKAFQDKIFGFGLKLGLLFQIVDDIIDITQSEEESGKSAGVDIDKNSFVNLLGLDKAIESKESLKSEIKNELESFEPKLKENLLTLISKYL
jgi:farnesyl diphosphate synthase